MNAVVEQNTAPQPLMTTEVTPMQMLHYAMSQGADLDRLEKLMELQERWEKNQAKKAFDAAISLAKAEIKPILKTREVDFVSRKEGAGRTNYKYEDFAQVATEVDPVLAKHGLSYRHRPRQEGHVLHITCILSHRDGYSEESTLSAGNDESGNKNAIQAIGSTATYLQRYTLKLALGLAASKDDDGRGSGKPQQPPEEAPQGYETWKADMTALADEGLKAVTDTWAKSLGNFRRWVVKYDEQWWLELKAKAGKVQK
jgi:hypothetical protein